MVEIRSVSSIITGEEKEGGRELVFRLKGAMRGGLKERL